jgi:hypothetical protein
VNPPPHFNSEPEKDQESFVPTIIESLRARGHLAPLPSRRRAWERALPPVVTPDDVKAAYRAVQLAWRGVELGADRSLYEDRQQEFGLALALWLNS